LKAYNAATKLLIIAQVTLNLLGPIIVALVQGLIRAAGHAQT
jgi:hypothetical protein